MVEQSIWMQKVDADPGHSHWYVERFRSMARDGEDLVGEARLVDAMAPRGAHILDSLAGTKRFNRWMAETVVQPYLGKRVLELGAGIGNMTQHLSRGRRSYMATDIDEEHLGRLRVRFRGRPNLSSGKVDLTAPEDFAELRGKFDTVVCLNVVEHVKDDLMALRNIRSALQPGGRAIVLVPQDQSLYGTHWQPVFRRRDDKAASNDEHIGGRSLGQIAVAEQYRFDRARLGRELARQHVAQ